MRTGRRGLFRFAPVVCKSVGITAACPDPGSVLGSEAMRELVRVGSVKTPVSSNKQPQQEDR